MRVHLMRRLMAGHDLRDFIQPGYGGDYPWKAVAAVPTPLYWLTRKGRK